MPRPNIWGPLLWKFLHSFGSKCGKTTRILKRDEEIQAHWILVNLEKVIPCKECVAHYVIFKHKNPIPATSSEYAKWLWDLHDSVNIKLEKDPSPEFNTLEYDGNILNIWKEYMACVEDSIQQNFIRRTHIIEFQRHVNMWIQLLI